MHSLKVYSNALSIWLITFSLFKHLTTIISQQLSVPFLNMFSKPFFSCKWLITCFTHSPIFSWGFYVIYVTVFFSMFYGFLLVINIWLKLMFHFIDIFTLIFWTAFLLAFSIFPNFHILLHCLFFILNNNLFIVFFNPIF